MVAVPVLVNCAAGITATNQFAPYVIVAKLTPLNCTVAPDRNESAAYDHRLEWK